MSKPNQPAAEESQRTNQPGGREAEQPGSNAVEHEPDPDAQPIADGEHRYLPRSPYTTGNY